MKRLAVAAALAVATATSTAARQGTVEPLTRTTAIRVAYTTFENVERVQSRGTLEPIVGFLRMASDALTRSTGRPVEFEVVLGNYYQVWSWFRARQVDAAIVSPFIGYLLERDGSALSVLELLEHDPEGTYESFIAGSQTARSGPELAYDRYLTRLLDEARGRASESDEHIRLNLVAHLSSSGFVMPTLYASHWLTKQQAAPAARARFWNLYFERARFTLHHGVPRRAEGKTGTEIFFSYTGRRRSSLDADVASGDLGQWEKLAQKKPDWPAPRIPPDLLVVRPSLAAEVLQSVDRNELADRLIRLARGKSIFTRDTVYTDVRRYNVAAQSAFRQAVDGVFSRRAFDPTLRRLNERWFDNAQFDFTIDETMGFLRQDQLNTGVARLALVLSGGGVKSLYQARLLDELYQDPSSSTRALRNFNEEPLGPNAITTPADDGPMTVHTIIGTSGGAMLAFFAALMPSTSVSRLTPLAQETASKQLFPFVDVPRVISVIAILLVVVICLHVAKAFNIIPCPDGAELLWQVPRTAHVLIAAPLMLMATALVIRFLRIPHIDTSLYLRGVEGLLYGLAAALIHLSAACIAGQCGGGGNLRDRLRSAQGRLGMILGVSMVATSFALRLVGMATGPADHVLVGLPILAAAGIVLTLLSAVVAASGGWLRLQLVHWKEYLSALAVVLIAVALSYLAVLFATLAERSTFLELTFAFWLWVGLGGLTVSVVMLCTTRLTTRPARFLQLGAYTLVRDRVGGLTLTVGAAMTAFFTVATILWVVLVAPAVYGSERAQAALLHALPERTLRSGAFRTNLIVTGALLADTQCPARQREYVAGPLYSCFEGPVPCVATSPHWETFRRPVPVRALQAVFASGSPFPVFPSHNVSLPNGCVVPLIDGGYAHNVPLEAAVEAEARQVLVVNASPDSPEIALGRGRWRWQMLLSDLAQGGERIFPFLFSRAQELDRSMARRLMVASLTPHPEGDDWPFLLDFRKGQQGRIIAQAEIEIRENRRIGHIEAWGTPLIYTIVRPPDVKRAPTPREQAPLLGRSRWLPEVRASLDRLLLEPAQGVAVFDLDNTCLRGDIGDALLLKIIAEMRYAGDREEFWSQIPDPQARATLREDWRQFAAVRSRAAGVRYAVPSTWPPGFADYVALFMQQYQRMLDQPDGARRAYPWAVQLMSGMSVEVVQQLARDVWLEEMRRGTTRQYVHSTKYGDVPIEGGVRIHAEVADLIRALTARGWQVWLVTASSQYVAEQAAARLGIDAGRVLGIRTRAADGALTAALEEPITYREGKVQALRDRKLVPAIVAGDSMTDYEMLQSAPLALVIDRRKIDHSLMKEPPTWLLQPANTLTTRALYD